MRSKAILGLISLVLLSVFFTTAYLSAAEIDLFDPSYYSLPHYKPREENLFPKKPVFVDLKPPITMGECAPCHENLENYSVPNLKPLNHWKHFSRGIKCDSCHFANPHTPDGVMRIPMRVCFNCHGLEHGPTGELAPSACLTCHKEKKKPSNHTAPWILKDHRDADTHECVMCHKSVDFCNECHRREGKRDIDEKEYMFLPFKPPSKSIALRVKIAVPEKMGDCYGCHKDIEKFDVPGLYFNHEAHFKKGIKCRSCHMFYPHQPDKTYRIPMQVCYSCHQVTHGPQGTIAPANCSLCHPAWFYSKKPADHTQKFIAGGHKDTAYKEPSYCSMCHKDAFCQKCHIAKSVVPDDHKDQKKWLHDHGKNRANLTYCANCHTEKYCYDCHQVRPIPHPSQYLADHGKSKIQNSKVCNMCHTDRTFCENCHHYQVANALLKRENCIKCHPDYKHTRFLDIKNRGHMVHAAHFEMTNTPPFTCDKCHALGYTLGHDYATFQLCKECHGAYRLGKLIAKWNVDNGELCVRCHRPGTGLPTSVKVTPP
jgi:hypothetical protein